jgi:hypothetical protein
MEVGSGTGSPWGRKLDMKLDSPGDQSPDFPAALPPRDRTGFLRVPERA